MTQPDPAGRVDARRNRARVLCAAEELFADRGIGVPLGEIAQRAGVGAGTVYRHFPTKETLYNAVVRLRIDQLGQAAEEALRQDDPTEAFYGFLSHAMERALLNAVLCHALTPNDAWQSEGLQPLRCEFKEHFSKLLESAQRAGSVRGDVDVDDVTALIPAFVAMVERRGSQQSARIVTMLWDGLAPGRANPVRARPLLSDTSRNSDPQRHETEGDVTKLDAEAHCAVCGAPLPVSVTGRPALYCGATCRQRARRRRTGA